MQKPGGVNFAKLCRKTLWFFVIGAGILTSPAAWAVTEADFPNSETCETFKTNVWDRICQDESVSTLLGNPVNLQAAMTQWFNGQNFDDVYKSYYRRILLDPFNIRQVLATELQPCINNIHPDVTTSALYTSMCPCEAGKYTLVSSGDSYTCTPCQKNTYRLATDPSRTCTPCPENGLTKSTGAKSKTECYVPDTYYFENDAGRFHYSTDCYLK